MHHGNHFYGHAHVLAGYCGLDPADPPRIEGYLQHGWNVVDGLGAGTPYAPGLPIFVWSERTRRRAWSMGRPHATVIGSPFLYLLHGAVEEAPEREGTIWYPFHGWEGQEVTGSHRRLIDEITATEPGPITFCLYWNEYQDARIRSVYEKAGRVICHGYRGYMRSRTDARFLHKQLAELRRHRRVASNRLSSAVLYGVAAGCAPAVYGDPMHLGGESLATAERIRREWPELHGIAPDPTPARATALAELGDGYLASPAELRAILGWTAVPPSPTTSLRPLTVPTTAPPSPTTYRPATHGPGDRRRGIGGGMIQMIGGEMPEYAEERPPAGGALYRHLLDRLPARTRLLVAGPHGEALLDALAAGNELTCLVRSQPDAERLAARGLRVLCGTLPKLIDRDRYDVVVALDGVGRLCSPDGSQYDWVESVRALKRTMRPGGTLLLSIENELGVHRLVDPGSPTAARTGDAWRPLGEFGSAPGRPDRTAALLAAEGFQVSGLAAAWPSHAAPTLLATPETLRYGPLDALAAFAARAVGHAYAEKPVLSDPRRLAATAVRRGLGAELAPAWLVVAHLGPKPSAPLPLPPALLTGGQPTAPSELPADGPIASVDEPARQIGNALPKGAGRPLIIEIAAAADGTWTRRVMRGAADLNGPLPTGRLLEELLLTAALGHDLPALRRLLTGWMAALPAAPASDVLVDGDDFTLLDPTVPDQPDALARFARTLLTGGYAHPWPGITDAARLTQVLAGAAGLPDAPPPPDPQPAPDSRRELQDQLDALRRRLAEATERNRFYEVELGKRDAELGRAKVQIAAFSGSLGYRAAKAGLALARKARKLLRKGQS